MNRRVYQDAVISFGRSIQIVTAVKKRHRSCAVVQSTQGVLHELSFSSCTAYAFGSRNSRKKLRLSNLSSIHIAAQSLSSMNLGESIIDEAGLSALGGSLLAVNDSFAIAFTSSVFVCVESLSAILSYFCQYGACPQIVHRRKTHSPCRSPMSNRFGQYVRRRSGVFLLYLLPNLSKPSLFLM